MDPSQGWWLLSSADTALHPGGTNWADQSSLGLGLWDHLAPHLPSFTPRPELFLPHGSSKALVLLLFLEL